MCWDVVYVVEICLQLYSNMKLVNLIVFVDVTKEVYVTSNCVISNGGWRRECVDSLNIEAKVWNFCMLLCVYGGLRVPLDKIKCPYELSHEQWIDDVNGLL